jgi:hypothetical protein
MLQQQLLLLQVADVKLSKRLSSTPHAQHRIALSTAVVAAVTAAIA